MGRGQDSKQKRRKARRLCATHAADTAGTPAGDPNAEADSPPPDVPLPLPARLSRRRRRSSPPERVPRTPAKDRFSPTLPPVREAKTPPGSPPRDASRTHGPRSGTRARVRSSLPPLSAMLARERHRSSDSGSGGDSLPISFKAARAYAAGEVIAESPPLVHLLDKRSKGAACDNCYSSLS